MSARRRCKVRNGKSHNPSLTTPSSNADMIKRRWSVAVRLRNLRIRCIFDLDEPSVCQYLKEYHQVTLAALGIHVILLRQAITNLFALLAFVAEALDEVHCLTRIVYRTATYLPKWHWGKRGEGACGINADHLAFELLECTHPPQRTDREQGKLFLRA